MTLTRTWLLITIPGILLGITLLFWTARSLVRTTRGAVLLSLPVVAEQTVEFRESGTMTLSVEGPFTSSSFSGLAFTLLDDTSGRAVRLERSLVHMRSASISRARLELYRLTLPSPGRYTLRITGLPASASPSDRIVFGRPFIGALVVHVLALIGLGGLLVGSLVLTGLVVARGPAQRGNPADAPVGSSTFGALEERVTAADVIASARTVMAGSIPRYVVLATWKGTLSPALSSLSKAGGLIVDTDRWRKAGYAPVAGQTVILFLAANRLEAATPGSVVLLEALELVPVEGDKAIFAFNDPARRRVLPLEELERAARR
ncbi:MAG: hypothetical protein ABJD11_17805 [Gemmatimonadota bacterium]